MAGPPKIYIEPAGPYEIVPGGNINVTCSAVAFPFPDIVWQRYKRDRMIIEGRNDYSGTTRLFRFLLITMDEFRVARSSLSRYISLNKFFQRSKIIQELNGNAEYSCFANNTEGSAERKINIIVKGTIT